MLETVDVGTQDLDLYEGSVGAVAQLREALPAGYCMTILTLNCGRSRLLLSWLCQSGVIEIAR